MVLSQLNLQNFRSYAKKTFEFSPATTLIVGPNTAGKTNILEAIMMTATGKSFRADSDREAIAWGSDVGRIGAEIAPPEVAPIKSGLPGPEQLKLEMVLTVGEVQGQKAPLKKYLVNGVARRQVDFVGNLRAVLFWPEHLELVTDSPSLRRKYLDSVLVQVDREYRRNLYSYERGLRQRNRLLDMINEGKADRRQLLFWNQLLIRTGNYLTDKRTEFIEFINNYFSSDESSRNREVSRNSSRLHSNNIIEYDKSVISESRLEQYKEEEVAAKATLVGPHRDDFVISKFSISNSQFSLKDQKMIELSIYGSRGEQRLAILWLKLAELSFIEQQTGERPILLLDDIFSELDEEHRRLVLDVVGKQQTIITSAEDNVVNLLEKKRLDHTIIRL
ncbi:DNA replication and repair protein RecF [Candidatus Gottesmanbacteria bacterium]|nr:DNA replication and repair protein RecF [Candidatus Gottesmanbacteria bacterium]